MNEFTVTEKFNDIGRIGSWAPGGYECICVSCDEHFVGDKRASRCLPCAVRALKERHEHVDAPASRENRIEALRAASRVVAGDTGISDGKGGVMGQHEATLIFAEQFAKWLETGER